MDLGTINKRLERGGSGGYINHIDFSNDVQLVFDNAMKYNGPVRAVFVLYLVCKNQIGFQKGYLPTSL